LCIAQVSQYYSYSLYYMLALRYYYYYYYYKAAAVCVNDIIQRTAQ